MSEQSSQIIFERSTMLSCCLLWITARGVAAGDGYDVSVFTHLSGRDANTSCSLVRLTRTADCYSLAACKDHTESGDQWCHTEAVNDTGLSPSSPEEINLEYKEQVVFVSSPSGSWLYAIHPSNFTFFKLGKIKPAQYKAFGVFSATQRLYFCYCFRKNLIGSTDLNGDNPKVELRNIDCRDLTVDNVNSIVFFVAFAKPDSMISRIKDDGYELVKPIRKPPLSIAAHPGTKTIFVVSYRQIISVDYNGKHFKTLDEHLPSVLHSIAVNPSGDMLYLGSKGGLFSFNLKTLTSIAVPINFPERCMPITFIVNAYNRVILSCKRGTYIIIYDPKTKDSQVYRIKKSYLIPLFVIRDCNYNNN